MYDEDSFEECLEAGFLLEAVFLDVFLVSVARAIVPWYLLDYDQHAPSPADHSVLDPAWLGHAIRGHLLSGASAASLGRIATGRSMASDRPVGAGLLRTGGNRLDDRALESS
jgi:hypothetical protein